MSVKVWKPEYAPLLIFIDTFYGLFGLQNLLGHADGTGVFFDVMDADESGAFHDTDSAGGDGAFHALGRGEIQGQTDHGFPGGAEKVRIAEALEKLQVVHQFQVLLVGFGKADAGVEDNPVVRHAGSFCNCHRFSEIIQNVLQVIGVVGVVPVVHQAAGSAGGGDDGSHLRVIFAAPDVVDQVDALRKAGPCDGALVGVKGDRDIEAAVDGFDDRNDAVDLLLVRELCIAGAGGFSADVDDVGALRNHLLCVLHGGIQVVPFAAVGEGVRCDIQDAHDVAVLIRFKGAAADLYGVRGFSCVRCMGFHGFCTCGF